MFKKLIFLIYAILPITTIAQDNIWYKADFEFQDRILKNNDSIVHERYKTYGVEKPYWKHDKVLNITDIKKVKNTSYILFKLDKDATAGGVFTKIEDKFLLAHIPRKKHSSIEALEALPGNDIPHKLYVSESVVTNISEYKSLEKLTKEDLVTAIKFVQSYSKVFEDILNANPEIKQFSLFKMAENLYHLKLYQLRYNPFDLPDEGNYLDKFKDDNELKSLFEGKQYFKLRL
ncbi:hypothetical protein [Hyunsoonleella pacifica]|uniref:Uncharacterized protein n=1 Tax=Hyunsoonleella pacifica TaxID=1080224 RepID=A0A4Q9FNY2_9FLAO|nr:hypothetical protein [Hyunsoonleella pacifica]TBN15483.1 hypothetical protein EYD46_10120 [Hyunsoonleella pacifica]GGD24453.1 hypothetical protein GCM10011368_28150 [Hyunsoonleella pacifica]